MAGPPTRLGGPLTPLARHQLAVQRAAAYGGVLSRRLLREQVGADDHHVARHVRAGRWRVHGTQTIAVHTGPLGQPAQWWRALWEVGEAIAVLDGVSALQVGGLTGYHEDRIHVSVRHTARVQAIPDIDLHKVIRRVEGELAPSGIPRTRPAIAAIRAAHWATSDRQAALVLVMPVQQGLTTPAHLAAAAQAVPGRNRRRLITLIVADLADGARALGELDFAALCRARGLPEPARQVLRRGPRGRIYLDVRFANGLVVEIDGAGHRTGLSVMDDYLRANEIALGHERVLRIDLVGMRLAPDLFMAQVARGLAPHPGSR